MRIFYISFRFSIGNSCHTCRLKRHRHAHPQLIPRYTRSHSGLLKAYFRCEPCERMACKPLPSDCEPIREAGICACCMTCALRRGQSCGARTQKCGDGLQCRPLDDSRSGGGGPGGGVGNGASPLEALLANRGVCQTSQAGNVLRASWYVRSCPRDVLICYTCINVYIYISLNSI